MLHLLSSQRLFASAAIAVLAPACAAMVIEPQTIQGFTPSGNYKVIQPNTTLPSQWYGAPVGRIVGMNTGKGAAAQAVRTKSYTSARAVVPLKHASALESSELLIKIVKGAKLHDIDPYLVKAVIKQESNFNPHAVSPKNAIGLMQVLPGTAKDLGLRAVDNTSVEALLHDPWISILVGSRYLAEQLVRFDGRVDLALAAYNAGPGAVQKAGNRVPNYQETQDYVRLVMVNYIAEKRAKTLAGVGA